MRDKTALFVLLYTVGLGLSVAQTVTETSTVLTTFPLSTLRPQSSSVLFSSSSPSSSPSSSGSTLSSGTGTSTRTSNTTSSSGNATRSHSSFAACSSAASLNGSVEDWNPSLASVKELLCYTGVEQKDHYSNYEDCYSDVAYCNIRYLQKQVRKACEHQDYTFTLRRWWFWLLVIGVPIIIIALILISIVSFVCCCCCQPAGYSGYDNKIYSVETAPPVPVAYGGRVYSSAF